MKVTITAPNRPTYRSGHVYMFASNLYMYVPAAARGLVNLSNGYLLTTDVTPFTGNEIDPRLQDVTEQCEVICNV